MNLVLTFDYELFGDGSGNVFDIMITPTQEILSICDSNNIKTTLFFEVIEYIRLKEEWDKGNTMGYIDNPIEAIEKQVVNAALGGHDIQLHVHPQWVNASYKEGAWIMDLSNWRVGGFDAGNGFRVMDLLKLGKETIEALIQPVLPTYKCTAFRAGGFNIMPSQETYKAMKELGLQLDSSVYPGGYETTDLSQFDYRGVSAHKDFWWASAEDITKEDAQHKEIMEIPIFALPQRRIQKLLNISKIKSVLGKSGPQFSSVAKTNMAKRSLLQKVGFLLGKEAFTWDFCLFTKAQHRLFLKTIARDFGNTRSTFVLIGHPKSLITSEVLKDLIQLTESSKQNYDFKTLTGVYEEFCH